MSEGFFSRLFRPFTRPLRFQDWVDGQGIGSRPVGAVREECSFQVSSDGKGFATAAGVGGVGIDELEPFSLQTILVVHGQTFQVNR